MRFPKSPKAKAPYPSSKGGKFSRGFRPSRRLGQNFLVDENVARKIAAFAAWAPTDTVVELGAGTGALLCVIAPLVKRLIAVEIDPRLLEGLRAQAAALGNVHIEQADARKLDFGALGMPTPLKIIGNIPYYASSEIIFNVLAQRAHIASATLMVQKEFAERICAVPGSKSYGIPTVLIGMFANISKGFDVAPSCFYPPPQVVSTLLRLDFLATSRYELADENIFTRTVRGLFAQRRKSVSNNLKRLLDGDVQRALWILNKVGVMPMSRAESLSLDDFVGIANALSELRLPHPEDQTTQAKGKRV